MHHRHDTLKALQLVPLVPVDAQLILASRQRSYVPGDVVAPTGGLHPMNTTAKEGNYSNYSIDQFNLSLSLCHSPCINPDQVAGPLNEPIHGNVRLVQVLHDGPPGTVQVVDVVLLAQLLNATPIRVGSSEPFAVSRTDINVYRTEVVVFLVARRPTARHLHVQLHRVHAQDHMAHVAQHIRSRHDPGEGW